MILYHAATVRGLLRLFQMLNCFYELLMSFKGQQVHSDRRAQLLL